MASFAGFTSSHTLAANNHAAQHNLEQGEILATQTKVGTGASTPSANTVLRGTGAGTSAYGQVSLTADVTGVLPLANGGTGQTTVAGYLTNIYPIGSLYFNATDATNPATLLGFGTWAAFGSGRVLIGNGTSDQIFTAGTTGGESNHTLTSAEMPTHTHDGPATSDGNMVGGGAGGISANITQGGGAFRAYSSPTTASTGGGGTHNNLQPYIVVYVWRRTA